MSDRDSALAFAKECLARATFDTTNDRVDLLAWEFLLALDQIDALRNPKRKQRKGKEIERICRLGDCGRKFLAGGSAARRWNAACCCDAHTAAYYASRRKGLSP